MSNAETPIKLAQEKLFIAERNTRQSEGLRTLAGNLYGYCPVDVSREKKAAAFGSETPSWVEDLLRDAMIAGCRVYADKLDADAAQLATDAAEILSGKRTVTEIRNDVAIAPADQFIAPNHSDELIEA